MGQHDFVKVPAILADSREWLPVCEYQLPVVSCRLTRCQSARDTIRARSPSRPLPSACGRPTVLAPHLFLRPPPSVFDFVLRRGSASVTPALSVFRFRVRLRRRLRRAVFRRAVVLDAAAHPPLRTLAATRWARLEHGSSADRRSTAGRRRCPEPAARPASPDRRFAR